MRFVNYNVENGIAHIEINRPDKMNAVVPQLLRDLEQAAGLAKEDRGVRVVVISGCGRAFSAGLDVDGFNKPAGEEERFGAVSPRTRGVANLPQNVPLMFRELAMPVIAAVHGVAFGAGLQIALGADLRYVTPDARLAFLEMRWGLIPDMAAFMFLRELMRIDVARDLLYSGRIVSGKEAVTIGLATRVEEDPLAAAFQTASMLAGNNPDALAVAKQLLNSMADSTAPTLLLLESVLQDMLIGSPNQTEAVKARMEKRSSVFGTRTVG